VGYVWTFDRDILEGNYRGNEFNSIMRLSLAHRFIFKAKRLAKKKDNAIASHSSSIESPSQKLFLGSTSERCTKCLILVTDLGIAGYFRLRRPDLSPLSFLAVEMFRNNVSNCALEEQWGLLVFGMKLAIGENIPVDVVLCVRAENLIFSHDACVHFADELEVFIRGVFVSVNLVGHLGGVWALGEEFLYHNEVWSVHVRMLILE
jgi:hypothetical protein